MRSKLLREHLERVLDPRLGSVRQRRYFGPHAARDLIDRGRYHEPRRQRLDFDLGGDGVVGSVHADAFADAGGVSVPWTAAEACRVTMESVIGHGASDRGWIV